MSPHHHDADHQHRRHNGNRASSSGGATAIRFLLVTVAVATLSFERFTTEHVSRNLDSSLLRKHNRTVETDDLILSTSDDAGTSSTETTESSTTTHTPSIIPSTTTTTNNNDSHESLEEAEPADTPSLLSSAADESPANPPPTTDTEQLSEPEVDTTATSPSSGRSKLVFHIGPLKTGTTSIQADLTGLNFRGHLLQDGWYYATEGQAVDETTQHVRPMKQVSGADANFIQDLKALLDQLKGRNVVHSFEGWSVDFAEHPELYQQMHEALHEDWDITIVSGYRPYFDWIVSLWSQTQKRDKFTFVNPDDWPWFEANGNHVRTSRLLPNVYTVWMSKLNWFTDSIVDAASPYFNVKTYHMDDPRDPAVAFVCDCLDGATTSCQKLKEQVEKQKNGVTTHENKGSLNPIHYDALGLAAHDKGLISNDKFSRYQLQKAIEQHVEKDMGQTAMNDWPMLCPEKDLLDELWEKSLGLDKTYMKGLWVTNPQQEENLKAKFNEKVENRSFCHSDVDKMLEDEEWMAFFVQFQDDSAVAASSK